MPNKKPVKPNALPDRHFRIPDDIYKPALEKSKRTHVPLSIIVRKALQDWLKEKE